jgi:hypothetical protein
VVATLFVFGLKRGVGAETISKFFSRLRLGEHVGCSPSALRQVMRTLERRLLETADDWEQAGIAHGEIRPVIGAVDETFLQWMMLVFMEGWIQPPTQPVHGLFIDGRDRVGSQL